MSAQSSFPPRRAPTAAIVALAGMAAFTGAAGADRADLADLGLEALLAVEVTSVSRKAQHLQDTAAAVFVVTNEDIRRSGVTSIPEALRMVPGLQVARFSNDKWAVSARGAAGRFANKLLVMIDGRSVYSPLFSGVLWEAQDMLLEDVDRIEVIRGPGAALWGANAVNGIINVITKKARDTQGGLAQLGAGTEEKGFAALRYGGASGEDTQYRVYDKTYARDGSVDMSGASGGDDSRSLKSGFRLDRRISAGDRLMATGDVYEARSGEQWIVPRVTPPYGVLTPMTERNRGVNLLGRYERSFENGSAAALQAYIDSTHLAVSPIVTERRDTIDLDFQHQLQPASDHAVVWGLGYRESRDEVSTSGFIRLFPDRESFRLVSAFVHDDISLVRERLRLIIGAKFEHHSFTGGEPQPNLRLLWTPDALHTIWAAASRAVRIPSRADRESILDESVLPPFSAGNPSPLPVVVQSTFQPGVKRQSEKLDALELGYRAQFDPRLALDLAAFSNRYPRLRGLVTGPTTVQFAPVPHVLQQLYLDNGLSGRTTGFEAALDWRPLNRWRLQASYSLVHVKFDASSDFGRNTYAQFIRDSAPRSQYSLRSLLDLERGRQLDFWLRHVAGIARGDIPAYTELDARYGWRVSNSFELSLVGQSLLHSRHREYFEDLVHSPQLQVQRSFYVQAKWRF